MSQRAEKRTLTPPLTRRGDPIVVGSVPTKYVWSNRFCTPTNASTFRPIARDTDRSATVYAGSPGAVDTAYPASESAVAGTMRAF
ncbi:MAG: hypothetical protein DMF94_33125 [Acidobacteria bacterium]|nr:MAG: hypothetical protein DMF94_33125 [Acidobacteriota bacterium]